MRMLRTLTRLAPVIAVSLFLAGCGINTIPTQDEATKTAWPRCRTSTSGAPT